MWVWIAVGVIALFILVWCGLRLLGRLSELRRAAVKLQRRQEEAMVLQAGAEKLQRTVLQVQERAERMQEKVATIQAGLGR
ncbi:MULTISPECIES: hypothetical protein [Actinoplanes]|uniref:hypothetical protein n=1 Tax=Actinoplanes TaxID=1865 RepID=UPI0005F2F696|nr:MULTISPECIES: hypothetical protein [Actinoplanes]